LFHTAREVSMVLLVPASRKDLKLRVCFVKRPDQVNTGRWVRQIIETKLKEAIAVLVFSFGGLTQFGRSRKAKRNTNAGRKVREYSHSLVLDFGNLRRRQNSARQDSTENWLVFFSPRRRGVRRAHGAELILGLLGIVGSREFRDTFAKFLRRTGALATLEQRLPFH
jgi:hypothetical protein